MGLGFLGGVRPRVLWVLALVLQMLGCGARQEVVEPTSAAFPGVTLQVGVITPEGVKPATVLDPVKTQAVDWESTRQATVQTRSEESVDPIAVPDSVDVLIFPGRYLGELVDQKTLAAWDIEQLRRRPVVVDPAAENGGGDEGGEAQKRQEDALQFSDFIPEVRDRVIHYSQQVMALPLGGSALVLVYRRDAFERPENQEAARAEGIKLEPPTTYDELDALARFFGNRDWDGDGELESGIALALGQDNEGLGTATLIARAAALGQHPDYFGLFFDEKGMQPRIASPPFVEALEALVSLGKSGPAGVESFDSAAARQAFREGKVALLIDRAERSSLWSDVRRPVRTAVAPLPGSRRVYEPRREEWLEMDRPNRPTYLLDGGGWLVGVTSRSNNLKAAFDFVKYLVSPEPSERLVSDLDFPLLPVRGSQAGAERVDPRRDIRGWGRAVSRTMNAERLVPGLRLPGASSYLDALERARLSTQQGGATTALSALEQAAGSWDKITEQLGRDRQRWHQRGSLNLLNPESLPPPAPAPAAPSLPPALR